MKIRFEPDPTLADQIGDSREVRGLLREAASEVRGATTERLPGVRRSRAFTRQWVSRVEGSGKDVRAVVGSKWYFAHLIEFGSANNPAYAPLRKAARALGLKLEEGR